MKRVISVALCVGLVSTMAFARGGWGNKNSTNQATQTTYLNQIVDLTEISELSQIQKDDLVFMYEEEKLARDVYKTLGDMWNARVFLNIQLAEQRHMDAVKSLMLKYSLEVPVLSEEVGVFENLELQDLYNQLVSDGKNSLEQSYRVGVVIEEADINDLENKISNTPSDIESVYKYLLNGSYKHLSAFNRMLDSSSTGSYSRYGRR